MSDGMGCKCAAWSANECCCNVDWTPASEIALRVDVAALRKKLAACEKDAERYQHIRNFDGTICAKQYDDHAGIISLFKESLDYAVDIDIQQSKDSAQPDTGEK